MTLSDALYFSVLFVNGFINLINILMVLGLILVILNVLF